VVGRRLLATAALLVRIQISLKNKKMGDISKGVVEQCNSPKKYTKKVIDRLTTDLRLSVLVLKELWKNISLKNKTKNLSSVSMHYSYKVKFTTRFPICCML
jgi:hypothetical protein